MRKTAHGTGRACGTRRHPAVTPVDTRPHDSYALGWHAVAPALAEKNHYKMRCPMGQLAGKLTSSKISELVLTPVVHACSPGTSLAEVVAQLREAEIGCIVITKEGVPVGIFSERDYLKKIACNNVVKSRPISEFMTPNPVCVGMNDSIGRVLIKMRMGRFRHVVITNDQGLLENVVSIKDILDVLLDAMSADD
jgi:CBS domain-containing protein